MLDLYSTHVFF